jgi:hypothetical protein
LVQVDENFALEHLCVTQCVLGVFFLYDSNQFEPEGLDIRAFRGLNPSSSSARRSKSGGLKTTNPNLSLLLDKVFLQLSGSHNYNRSLPEFSSLENLAGSRSRQPTFRVDAAKPSLLGFQERAVYSDHRSILQSR